MLRRFLRSLRLLSTLVLPSLALVPVASADEFDRFEGEALNRAIREPATRGRSELTLADLGELPRVLKDQRAAVLAVRTDQGNPSRVRLAPAFRKAGVEGGPPVPILVIERFDTFENGPATHRLAHGQDLVLFDGFLLDLDTGQIVPEGQGGDLRFQVQGDAHGKLLALDPARLFLLDADSAPNGSPTPGRPSAGRAVLPADFAGRYRLVANGQWSGSLELNPGPGSRLSGRFRSDQTGASYPVTGQVGGESAHQIAFRVDLPRSSLEFQGRLWTEGKQVISGLVTLQRRQFGFVALREGARVDAEGLALESPEAPAASPGRIELRLAADGSLLLGSRTLNQADQGEAFQGLAERDATAQVLVTVEPATPYHRLAALLKQLQEAGLGDVRLMPDDSK